MSEDEHSIEHNTERYKLIQRFSLLVANGPHNGSAGQPAYDTLKAEIDDNQLPLLDHLNENYQQACVPTEFLTAPLHDVDAGFEQAYELLRLTFDPSVLAPREAYVNGMRRRKESAEPNTSLHLARSFRVSGAHRYDQDGQLTAFNFDPLTATESAVSIISGSYIGMDGVGRGQDGVAGIGHLATRLAFRRKGHAQAVTEMFEEQMQQMAQGFGQTLRLILLESEPSARPFWAACGYRWPADSRYYQPPISFNGDTGEKDFDEVPELLMVKPIGTGSPDAVDKQLLLDGVKALYQRWYASEGNNQQATDKINDYVFGKLFADFAASVAQHGNSVPLLMPPLE